MFNKVNIIFLALYFLLIIAIFFAYPVNPIALDFTFFSIHWYGILFVCTLIMCRFKMLSDIKKINKHFGAEQSDSLIIYSFLGVLIGARLFYILVYADLIEYIENPLLTFDFKNGGLSFHGGLIGLITGVLFYCRKYKVNFLKCMDVISLTAPIGLTEGRIGNFINGELWGKITNSPIGVVFEHGGDLPRHPSQLYESFLEGVVIFFILKFFSRKQRPNGSICGLFLILYSIFRFSIEFVREPDSNLGYLAWDWLTMGQILCIPMFIIGIFLILFYKRNIFSNKLIALK